MSQDAVDTASESPGDRISVNLSKPPITPCAGKREGFYPPFLRAFWKAIWEGSYFFTKNPFFFQKKYNFWRALYLMIQWRFLSGSISCFIQSSWILEQDVHVSRASLTTWKYPVLLWRVLLHEVMRQAVIFKAGTFVQHFSGLGLHGWRVYCHPCHRISPYYERHPQILVSLIVMIFFMADLADVENRFWFPFELEIADDYHHSCYLWCLKRPMNTYLGGYVWKIGCCQIRFVAVKGALVFPLGLDANDDELTLHTPLGFRKHGSEWRKSWSTPRHTNAFTDGEFFYDRVLRWE